VPGPVPSTRAQHVLSIPVSSVYSAQQWLQKVHSDEVDPPNKSGHVLPSNVPNNVWAKLSILRSVLSTFF